MEELYPGVCVGMIYTLHPGGRDVGFKPHVHLVMTKGGLKDGEWVETLSVHYQRERLHLESGDLTALVVQALCYCAVRAIDANSANSKETPSDFIVTTAQVVQVARAVAKREDGDPSTNLPVYQSADFSPTTS